MSTTSTRSIWTGHAWWVLVIAGVAGACMLAFLAACYGLAWGMAVVDGSVPVDPAELGARTAMLVMAAWALVWGVLRAHALRAGRRRRRADTGYVVLAVWTTLAGLCAAGYGTLLVCFGIGDDPALARVLGASGVEIGLLAVTALSWLRLIRR